jgi:elongation factor G
MFRPLLKVSLQQLTFGVRALAVTRVPDSVVGDVMGDLPSTRRGRVLGMDQVGSGFTVIEAQTPLTEVQRYATDLRSMTQDRGIFSMEISHYEVCPNNIAEQIISEHKKELELTHTH